MHLATSEPLLARESLQCVLSVLSQRHPDHPSRGPCLARFPAPAGSPAGYALFVPSRPYAPCPVPSAVFPGPGSAWPHRASACNIGPWPLPATKSHPWVRSPDGREETALPRRALDGAFPSFRGLQESDHIPHANRDGYCGRTARC